MLRSASEDVEPTTVMRRVGRPSKQVLTRSLIIETALRMLDEHGVEGIGMRDIARKLGVRASALYNHVASKDEILLGVRELIGARIVGEAFDQLPWNEAIEVWARSYRDAFAAHPASIAVFAVTPIGSESNVSEIHERVIAALHGAGWARGEALSILVALESFILGSALDAAADPEMMDPGTREDVPHLSAAYREQHDEVVRTGSSRADLAFNAGLRLMIDSLIAVSAAR